MADLAEVLESDDLARDRFRLRTRIQPARSDDPHRVNEGAPSHYRSYNLYGAKITPVTSAQMLELLSSNIAAEEQCVVASQNLHGLHVRLWDEASRRLHSMPKTYVHIDGMPVVALCRLSGIDASRQHRVTVHDFIWPLLTHASNEGWRVSYVGSTERVVAAGCAVIRKRLPHLRLVARHGHFRTSQEAAEAARTVATFDPQLVVVGMGMGQQERWILDNLRVLAPASIITAGACMELIAGALTTPPQWMGRAGCEWLFRLLEHPSRVWYRYLIEPWFVLAYILWYSSLPEAARLAGRIEELERISLDAKESDLSNASSCLSARERDRDERQRDAQQSKDYPSTTQILKCSD